jgi:epoxyqueuosine reductase QueG
VATGIVRAALAGSGIEHVGSCSAAAYDAAAPPGFRASHFLPGGARGLIVAGSAGPALWRAFRARTRQDPSLWDEPNPYDAYVATVLSRVDAALAREGIAFRRFEAAFHAPVRVDFLALARLAALGSPGPFRLYIDGTYGPWWALRGAWLVDAEVEPPRAMHPPCVGCPAPCVGGRDKAGGITSATAEVRARCVVGQEHRYDDDQIAYHYDRERTRLRLREEDRA